MKLKRDSLCFVLMAGCMVLATVPLHAQTKSTTAIAMVSPITKEAPVVRRETLSGLDLYPVKQNNGNVFMLSFQQDLKEDGLLYFSNASGKTLFTKAVPAGDHTWAEPINIGNLKAGIYLVEVKTPTTVYWKKVRVKLR